MDSLKPPQRMPQASLNEPFFDLLQPTAGVLTAASRSETDLSSRSKPNAFQEFEFHSAKEPSSTESFQDFRQSQVPYGAPKASDSSLGDSGLVRS